LIRSMPDYPLLVRFIHYTRFSIIQGRLGLFPSLFCAASITEWCIVCLAAVTKVYCLLLLDLEGNRALSAVNMGAITERHRRGFSASASIVAAWFQFENNRSACS